MKRLSEIAHKQLGLENGVISSDGKGYPAQHIECLAFAWLAKQTLEQLPGNVPSVTGASKAVILGAIYQ